MFYLIIDENIQLRTLRPEDAGILFQLVDRNRSRLHPWIDPDALPGTIAAARKLTIEGYFNSLPDPGEAMLEYSEYLGDLVRYIPPSNPPLELGIWVNEILAGEILLGVLRDNITTAEFGYWIDRDKEGQGIVTRCVAGLMDYAIGQKRIERFLIGCAAVNRRSSAIPERLGYRLLATVPDGEVVGDYVYDRLIYEMRAEAWLERQKSYV